VRYYAPSPIAPIGLGVKAADPNRALVPSELMVHGDRCTLVVSTHNGGYGGSFADEKGVIL
jgi:hypothetical protein